MASAIWSSAAMRLPFTVTRAIPKIWTLDRDGCRERRKHGQNDGAMSDVNGLLVNFIDLESLKRNKMAVGRHQDLADVENLTE